MKYWAVYKCPLCGKLSRLGDSVELPYDKLPEILASVIKNQQFLGHPLLYRAPLHIPCKCDNGNAGLAQFAGFMQDKSEQESNAASFLNKLIGNKD